MLASARKQDSSKLLHMKKEDLRLLIIAPTEDKLVNGRAVVNELKRGKCFGDVEIEVKEIKGGSHACFLDNEDETVDAVLEFANSVQVSSAFCLFLSADSYWERDSLTRRRLREFQGQECPLMYYYHDS
jgi:hypothetical protein